jgi:hypothetical protein
LYLNLERTHCEDGKHMILRCRQLIFEAQVIRRQQLAQAPKKNTLGMRGGGQGPWGLSKSINGARAEGSSTL